MLIHILFGSQTGNSQNLAHVISESLENEGFNAKIFDMGSVDPEKISEMSFVLVVTSTYGDGEPPDNASEWMHYTVLGLGDTYYPHFCQCGKDFDYYLSKHGGHRLAPRLDCDLYYEEQYGIWLDELITVLKNKLKE
jgi:sulfite reductase (NADPH) flavoprotein alpha-component